MTVRTVDFVAKIKEMSMPVPEAGCWIWLGASSKGYGQVSKVGEMLYAHRVAFEAFVGPIPDGMDVLHTCDTPSCVNPDHLTVGSHADNMADMVAKGRSPRMIGENHHQAKLTWGDVENIRIRHAAGGETFASLGREFSVNECSISRIVKGKSWVRGFEKWKAGGA